jgi:uncharacterized membrane protein YbhN (UPF0104 family)
LVAVLAWGVWVWSRVLTHFGTLKIPLPALQRIWFLSNLARYVPGKVFQFVAAAHLGRDSGVPAAILLTSIVVHSGLALVSAGVISAWTLGGGLFGAGGTFLIPLAVTGVAVAGLHPAVLNGALRLVPRFLHRDVIRWGARWRDGIGLLILSLVSWFLYGLAYQLFLTSLVDIPWQLLPQMTGVNGLSFLVGFVSVLPGGIGLREVTMAELLDPYVAPGVGAVLAVASRLWTMAAEILGGALVVLVLRGSMSPTGPGSS